MRRKLFVQSTSPVLFVPSSIMALAPSWNPNDSSPNLNFSNNNRTISTGSSAANVVRSNVVAGATQLVYIEVVLDTIAAQPRIGFATSAAPLTGTNLGSDFPPESWSFNFSSGVFNMGGSASDGTTMIGPLSAGNVLGIALNRSNKKLWVNVNGGGYNTNIGGTQDPATDAGGLDSTAIFGENNEYVAGQLSAAGDQLTIRLTSAQWTGSAPAGFTGF